MRNNPSKTKPRIYRGTQHIQCKHLQCLLCKTTSTRSEDKQQTQREKT